MRLSILTPTLSNRAEYASKLFASIHRQYQGGDLGQEIVPHLTEPVHYVHRFMFGNDVELIFDEDKGHSRGGVTVGEKRQRLLNSARGEYVAFCDDDDAVSSDYVYEILKAIRENPGVDAITFQQAAYFDGVYGKVEFGHDVNEEWSPERVTKRMVWHVCAIRREIALQSTFPAVNWGEDWRWLEPLQSLIKTKVHIPKELHEYHYRTEVSEAKADESSSG